MRERGVKVKRVGERFFLGDEGSLTIFSLFLFVLILLIAGTAVDLIRHERDRVAMQNTLDTAVLAASGVSQGIDPTDVVKNYVSKAGFDAGAVQVSSTANYTGQAVTSRSVTASSLVQIDTMFMDMMGIESLRSPSYTAAEERNTKIEIALVLDISGSMNYSSADPTKSKIDALKAAAKEFVRVIFATNDPQDIVVSIIPYNQQVTVPDSIMTRLALSDSTVNVTPAPYTGALAQYQTGNPNAPCLVFETADYNTRELTSSGTATRSGRFLQDQFYWSLNGLVQQAYQTPYEWAQWCNNAQPRIFPYSNNETDLTNYIDGLWAYGATAINIGMNWGTAMLDPTFRPIVEDMVDDGEIPAELGIYPTGYDNPDSQKYIVLMTDGANTNQFDLTAPFKSGPSRVWYAASETAGGTNPYAGYFVLMPNKSANSRFYRPRLPTTTSDDSYVPASALPADAVQLDYHQIYERFGVRSAARYFFQHSDSAAYSAHYNATVDSGFSNADTNSRSICGRAKQNQQIKIYTVAFEAPSGGQALLRDCATAPGFYFDVDGTQISDAFSAIANQIALLRLTE
jgi:Flp pilus assembly protein TadG